MSTNDKNRFRKTYSFFRQQPIFASGGGGGGGGGGNGDQFWYSTTNDSIYTTGSVIIRGDETGLDSPFDVGSDVFFYVSGSIDAINPNDSKVAVFGGDLVVSGAFLLESDYLEITGTLVVTEGVSGSITKLADGTSYLVAGSNITITSQSNGSIVISSTGGGGSSINFFDSTTAGSVYTTGSFAFRGQELIDSPSDVGTDVFFFVSGSTGAVSNQKSLFGGDVVVSGSFFAEGDRLEMTGTILATSGFSGSLTKLTDGTSYLVAGNNVNIVSQSNGSIVISSTGGGGDSFFSSTTAGSIYTTGSAAFRGQESIDSPIDKGTDVFFYVSGSKGSRDTSVAGSSLFGGDVIVSGSTYMLSGAIVQNGLRVTGSLDVEGDIVDISGSLIVTGSTYLSGTLFLTGSMFSEMGSITAVQGFSGSLTKLADGTSYLVAGNNVNIVSQSNGSIVISSTGGGSSTVNLQFLAGTVSSAAPSGSMESIGMDYLNLSALPPVPTNYTFSAILATTAGTTAYMDLYDYNGIFSGGSPGPISGSVLTGSSQSYTYLTANLTTAMSSPSGNGIIEARIWCDPTGSNLNAICKSARLTIS